MLKHDSRRLEYRKPFGAVTAGTTVEIAFLCDEAETSVSRVRLRIWADGHEVILEPCRDGDMYTFMLHTENTGLIWYYFLLDTPGGVRYYGAPGGDAGAGGEGRVYDYPPASYQLTVYAPDYETPEWFRESIMYQVFPDRFYRGTGGRGGLDRAVYHRELGRHIRTHEDWSDSPDFLPTDGQRNYDPCDFFGGDIDGIIQKLDYIRSLGAVVLYLNPIFESASNHRYNTSDYMKTDPILGTDDDVRRLAEECGKRGMRVMLDGVFSHTGDDSVYFNKYGRYASVGAYQSPCSEYYKWYRFTGWPDAYQSWWGFTTLPEVNELEPSYSAFVASVLDKWASLGIYCWRLDVADELPDPFIADLRSKLKALSRESVLLGEVWEDASSKEAYGVRRRYVDGRELDSAMDYPFTSAVVDFLLMRADAHALCARLTELRENYPEPFYMAQMNLLGSHDTARILTQLAGAPSADALTRPEQAAYVLDSERYAYGKARLKLAALLQMTVPGVPCIYYGDEAGMTGMTDPFNRKPFPWGHEDAALLDTYKLLTGARSAFPPLKRGGAAFAALTENVLCVMREHEGQSAISLVNRSMDSIAVSISRDTFCEGPDCDRMNIDGVYEDAFTGAAVAARCGILNIVLSPLSGALLLSRSGNRR